MKKNLIAAAILAALSTNQVIADDDISGATRLHKSTLIVPCVLVGDTYFDATLKQRGRSLNFEVNFAEEETNQEACIAAADAMLALDEDTTDLDGEGSVGDPEEEPEEEPAEGV